MVCSLQPFKQHFCMYFSSPFALNTLRFVSISLSWSNPEVSPVVSLRHSRLIPDSYPEICIPTLPLYSMYITVLNMTLINSLVDTELMCLFFMVKSCAFVCFKFTYIGDYTSVMPRLNDHRF